jgi:hypothetical protein
MYLLEYLCDHARRRNAPKVVYIEYVNLQTQLARRAVELEQWSVAMIIYLRYFIIMQQVYMM